ncbi:MAG TPA: chemotaxis-specific protein-glutamate methyltransferase CheB [Longimicrobiales bacterium]
MTRVLVVDDSATCRHLLVTVLASDPALVVVGEARTGVEALELTLRLTPDIIVMDVHMPEMDGLEATRRIMARRPTPILIVTSSASRDAAERSLAAMHAGALMVIAKPDDPASPRFEDDRRQLLELTRALADVKVVRRRGALAGPVPAHATASASAAPVPTRSEPPPRPARAGIVAVAASTGGPTALRRLLGALPADLPVPVAVVQHMARGFIRPLESFIAAASALPVTIAENGRRLAPGVVHLAPEDRHLRVSAGGRVVLDDGPPIDGFRPSATALFESVAEVYGAAATAVVLTGMGRDGVQGLRAVRDGGGMVLAQDRESSVVYGMAGEAVRSGVVDAVLPIDAIVATLVDRFGRLNG